MNTIREMNQKHPTAGLISVGLTILTSVLGIYNWLALRSLILSLLAFFEVKPSAWQGIDNITFLLLGIIWLANVYYSQWYLKKKVIAKQVLKSIARLLSIQMWILFISDLLSNLLIRSSLVPSNIQVLLIEGSAAILLTLLAVMSARHQAVQKIKIEKEG
ncbi:hypothetical protein EHS13_17575 [Paenibacillus psychroresistens]|uniref:Uncharacterized protein n=1 Tax=Paenibacillus psychroresistens TaxID=1778678 RepID=A0A6B8RLP1_9BACL|nr:hypothetical protein [Paenibacillus psychroresistens]QGQ96562.1 hypothetical protein EHS13_17575 [Paenibacillus psychroresistens]